MENDYTHGDPAGEPADADRNRRICSSWRMCNESIEPEFEDEKDPFLIDDAGTLTLVDNALTFYQFLTIPETVNGTKVVSIGEYAFLHEPKLAGLNVEEGLAHIGREAFYGCDNLSMILLPNTLKSIGEAAFAFCGGIVEAHIPVGVTDIGDHAFHGCTELATVHIPGSVQRIGKDAFGDCRQLRRIFYGGTRKQWKVLSKDAGLRRLYILRPNWEDKVPEINVSIKKKEV